MDLDQAAMQQEKQAERPNYRFKTLEVRPNVDETCATIIALSLRDIFSQRGYHSISIRFMYVLETSQDTSRAD